MRSVTLLPLTSVACVCTGERDSASVQYSLCMGGDTVPYNERGGGVNLDRKFLYLLR